MKSIEFLTEAKWKIPKEDFLLLRDELKIPKDLIQIIYDIKQKCQPFLQQVNDPLSLYHGSYTTELTLHKKVRLEDRRPLCISKDVHCNLNKIFSEEFGEPFRNSVFASGDKGMTAGYGDTFNIFPIGNFTFLWSSKKEYKDLFIEYRKYQVKNKLDKFYNDLDLSSYSTKNLNQAIKSNQEIMIRCKEYYAINYNQIMTNVYEPYELLDNIREYLK